MKRLFTLSILHIALCTIILAVPAHPGYLRHLLETGDTARYEEMVRHQSLIAQRTCEIQQARIRRAPQQSQQAFPLNIAPHGLVILVSFKDKAFSTPLDTMRNMINGENYTRYYKRYDKSSKKNVTVRAKGSARQYFIDQSWGQYQPQFDVVGPYTLSNNLRYYGQNDSQGYDNPERICDMIVEACQLADADGVDFTLYDNNSDGDIDFVYVIYAGEGEADGGASYTIWPHTYWVKDQDGCGMSVQVDGKYINTYACGNEVYAGTTIYDGIGTFCHEFGHVLGLPDLYSTGGNTSQTKLMGDWDIMDSGSYNNDGNTPPSYSAYERFFLGWLTPTQISDNASVVLHPLNAGQGAALIATTTHNLVGNDPNPATFYMLENRLKDGWDAHIPGQGMMLTKIQYSYNSWFNNTVNNTKTKLGVDIIEADGDASYSGYYGKAEDLFPEGGKKYEKITNYKLTNIDWSDTEITDIVFTLNNGGSIIEIGQMPTAVESHEECTVQSAKCMVNGQIVIIRGEQKYDIVGRRVE